MDPEGYYLCHLLYTLCTHAVPSRPRNVRCSGGATLALSWEAPLDSDAQSSVFGYQVEVGELRHRSGAMELEEVSISESLTEASELNIMQGLGEK